MVAEQIKQNKRGWNAVAHHFHGVDALPRYGPFAQKEEELGLFGEVRDKKVLEIGCGSGHSLHYMRKKGASELWGVDLSDEQIKAAKELLQEAEAKLFCAPMEEEIGLPKGYFDYVYSIYAIGWTMDLPATFKLIHSYLKKGGIFIFSWDHPVYAHLKSKNGRIYLDGSYLKEEVQIYENFKGEDASLFIRNRMFSTYINELIHAGFAIDKVIESDVSTDYDSVEEKDPDRYYSLYKARRFPATMMIRALKK